MSQYTANEVRILKSHEEYYQKVAVQNNKRLAVLGAALAGQIVDYITKPTFLETLVAPKSNVIKILYKTDNNDVEVEEDRESITLSDFSDLHDRLVSLLNDALRVTSELEKIDEQQASLLDLARVLNSNHQILHTNTNQTLCSYLDFCETLLIAKEKVHRERYALKERGLPYTWQSWVSANLKFTNRHAYRCLGVATLVKKYNRLKLLHISFSELIKLSTQIKNV